MLANFPKKLIILSLAMVFLAGTVGVSNATLTMDEIRSKFFKEEGKEWNDATSEEKRGFLKDAVGGSEYEEQDTAVRVNLGSDRPDFDVRYHYEKQTGVDWDDATEEEQEKFLKEYELLKKKWKREEQKRLKEEERRARAIAREEAKRKKAIELKERKRLQAEAKKEKELQKKRKDEKARRDKQDQKWESFFKKFKSQHKNSNTRRR